MPNDGPPAVIASASRYPLRSDLLAVGNLGAPPRWHSPGYTPLKSVQLAPRTPDLEFVSTLKPLLGKEVFDPAVNLNATQRDDLSRLLDVAFGTPAAPTVKLPGNDDLAKLKLEEMFADGLPKGKTAKQVAAETAAAAASTWADLKLDDATLARGGLHYRRWCIHCHGESGAGDGAQAAQTGSYPRDYRQGIFKFVSATPLSSAPRRGERGKPRKDDLRRTIRNGLDGSIMPGFPTLTDTEVDEVIAYIAHLSVRGETEFETMAKAMKPGDDDPDFVGKDLERLFAAKQ
jgi:mono/diheme cytochrome c family protein